MNIAAEPGTSCRQAELRRRYGLSAMVLDRNDGAHMNAAWGAYCRGGDDKWSREEFLQQRNLLHFAVFDGDGERLECVFGLELCSPHYVEFCYFADSPIGRRGVLRRCAPAIVDICHFVTIKWCHGNGSQGALRLTGRRGWSRILKALHIERDELGFIYENQERFRHGLQ